MNLATLLFLAFVLAALPVGAQEKPPAKETPSFRTLGLGYSAQDLFYLKENKDVPLSITEDSRSQFFVQPGGTTLSLYRLTKNTDGEVKRQPVVSVELTKGGRLPLLLFSPGKTAPVVEVLDDSLATFPAGSYRVLNRLGEEIRTLFGKSPATVPGRSDRVIDGEKDRNGNTLFVQIHLAGKNPPKLVFSNNWAFGAGLRTMVVVMPPVAPSNLPAVRRIAEPVEMITPLSSQPAPQS